MKIDLKERAKNLKRDIPAVFLAWKDPRTPILAKILAGAAVIYALSPIDLIPDFIPVIGYLDDLLLLPMLITAAVKLIPKEVWADCRRQAEDLWDQNKPGNKLIYALPILVIWTIIIILIVRKFLG